VLTYSISPTKAEVKATKATELELIELIVTKATELRLIVTKVVTKATELKLIVTILA
jgi:hypothetical protein